MITRYSLIMTKTQTHRFGMFTEYGNTRLGELAEQYLNEQPLTPYDIDLIVWSFDKYIETEQIWFAAHHGEYSDTAVRDSLHDWFTAKLKDGFYRYISQRAEG